MKQRYHVIFKSTGNQPKYFLTRYILIENMDPNLEKNLTSVSRYYLMAATKEKEKKS